MGNRPVRGQTVMMVIVSVCQLYEDEPILQSAPPCVFASSVQQQALNIDTLLTKAFTGELLHWYAHW